jgi:hypothetical protein
MDLAALLNLPSLAGQLAHTGRRNGRRTGFDWLTLHYNGPAVAAAGNPAGEIVQLQVDARDHIKRDWDLRDNTPPVHGQRIMYDLAVLSDGSAYVLGDPEDLLFHCRNQIGNARSYALHVPIGAAQDVTEPQWQSVVRIYERLAAHHGWPGVSRFVGHREWPRGNGTPMPSSDPSRLLPSQSVCPGQNLMTRLIGYRNSASVQLPAGAIASYVIVDPCSADPASNFANVRQAPDLGAPIAGQLQPGTPVLIDSIHGEWAHLAPANPFRDLGFVSASLLRKAA